MGEAAQSIFDSFMKLPESDRFELFDRICVAMAESLPGEAGTDEEWENLISRRVGETPVPAAKKHPKGVVTARKQPR